MPVFNKWINDVDFTKIEYFLIVWAIYNVLVYTLMIPVPEAISFVISPIGFVVLGYYLRHTERKIFNNSLISIIMILLPAVIMLIYSYSVVDSTILFVFHRYSFLVMVEAIGVFCLFKTVDLSNTFPGTFKSIISSIAISSYGMYLIHSQIIMIFRKILHISFNFTLTYLLFFAVGFILSWLIISILAKIPFIDDYIGVK